MTAKICPCEVFETCDICRGTDRDCSLALTMAPEPVCQHGQSGWCIECELEARVAEIERLREELHAAKAEAAAVQAELYLHQHRAYDDNIGRAYANRRELAREIAKFFACSPEETAELVAYSHDAPAPEGGYIIQRIVQRLRGQLTAAWDALGHPYADHYSDLGAALKDVGRRLQVAENPPDYAKGFHAGKQTAFILVRRRVKELVRDAWLKGYNYDVVGAVCEDHIEAIKVGEEAVLTVKREIHDLVGVPRAGDATEGRGDGPGR